MIQINDNDLPITVAEKIITGTRSIKPTDVQKLAYKVFLWEECGETIEEDMFSAEEIREIADHLYAYVRANEGGGQ